MEKGPESNNELTNFHREVILILNIKTTLSKGRCNQIMVFFDPHLKFRGSYHPNTLNFSVSQDAALPSKASLIP